MTDEDLGWGIDDGDHDLDDEPGYDHYDRRDDYEPSEPDFDAIAASCSSEDAVSAVQR